MTETETEGIGIEGIGKEGPGTETVIEIGMTEVTEVIETAEIGIEIETEVIEIEIETERGVKMVVAKVIEMNLVAQVSG